MFEFKKSLKTWLLTELHNAMPHYSADEIFHGKNYEKKTNNKKGKNKNFTEKTKCLILNAPSNNAKMQSYKNLTAQIYFVHTIQQMAIFLNETR